MSLAAPPRAKADHLDPSWRRWLALVTLAVEESQRAAWGEPVHAGSGRSVDAPLLHGAAVRVDAGQASTFVRRLAADLGILDSERVDPLAVILAGIERDPATLDAVASRLAVPIDTVAVLAQLCALPVLLNAAKALGPETPRAWQRGYCPVCGAWPSLSEVRGIQRERWLRCGCCSGDWVLPVLRCAFCGEMDHTRLGYLLPDDGEQHIRVETCATCRGYLKTLTTLGALPFTTLATKDLATVAFDLAARDRGFARPTRPGWQLHVEIVQ